MGRGGAYVDGGGEVVLVVCAGLRAGRWVTGEMLGRRIALGCIFAAHEDGWRSSGGGRVGVGSGHGGGAFLRTRKRRLVVIEWWGVRVSGILYLCQG